MHKIIFILIISGISLLLGGCKEGTILSSLNQRQSNEVLAALHKHQIQAVKVPQEKGCLPFQYRKSRAVRPFIFCRNITCPVMSGLRLRDLSVRFTDCLSAVRKARLISAIEQRLEQSLLSFDAVTGARVHLSYPLSGPETPGKTGNTPRLCADLPFRY